MAMKKRIYTALVVMMWLSLACEEQSNIQLDTQSTGFIVVEGILTNELLEHRVQLTHTYRNLNEEPAAVSGASITLSDGNSLVSLAEVPEGSGEYFTPPMRAAAGKTYTVTILFEGKQYTAQDRAVGVEPLQAIQVHATGDLYQLGFSQWGQQANFIEHSVSWKNIPTCQSSNDCEGRLIFYDLKTIDVNDIFKPEKETFTFPRNSVIVRRKHSVSDPYRAFLRAMLSETEWRGGVFDIQRADVPTNFSAGAIGFFAVSTVVSDTTIVQ
jgi:hypothetical protein